MRGRRRKEPIIVQRRALNHGPQSSMMRVRARSLQQVKRTNVISLQRSFLSYNNVTYFLGFNSVVISTIVRVCDRVRIRVRARARVRIRFRARVRVGLDFGLRLGFGLNFGIEFGFGLEFGLGFGGQARVRDSGVS